MPELAIRINMPREMGWLERFEWKGTVVLPAHVLETFKKRAALMVRRLGCPYVIDPHTYVFGGATDEIVGRRWFGRLVAEYGIDTAAEPDRPPLSPSTLVENDGPTDALRDLVQSVTEYQNNVVPDASGDVDEYEDFESGGENSVAAPRWVVPPYFYMEGGEVSDWLAANVKSIELAAGSLPDKDSLRSMIMIDQEVLSNPKAIDEIAAAYRALPVTGHMVWVGGMDEVRAKESVLVDFQRFVDRLCQDGKPLFNAYGGLFSLANDRISGTSHAMCYGEHRSPFEAGGTVFSARFYLPELYSKVPYARQREVTQALQLKECQCKWCVTRGADEGMGDLEHAALHFLERRTEDLAEIERAGGAGFLSRLETVYAHASGNDVEGAYASYYSHFETWHQAFESSSKRAEG